MKVKELLQSINFQLSSMPQFENYEVVIPICGERGIGARSIVLTTGASPGFDWDDGKFFIDPAQSLYRKQPKK